MSRDYEVKITIEANPDDSVIKAILQRGYTFGYQCIDPNNPLNVLDVENAKLYVLEEFRNKRLTKGALTYDKLPGLTLRIDDHDSIFIWGCSESQVSLLLSPLHNYFLKMVHGERYLDWNMYIMILLNMCQPRSPPEEKSTKNPAT